VIAMITGEVKPNNSAARLYFRRALKVVTAVICALVIFLRLPGGTVIYPEAEATNASISKLRDQIKKNEKEQAELKAQIASAKKEVDSYLYQKNMLDKQISLKEQNIELKEQLIEELELEISNMLKRLKEKESDLEKKYEDFRVQLRLSYEDKDYSLLEILFSSESLIDFLVNAERTAILLEYQANMLNELKFESEDLHNLKVQHENALQEQREIKANLEKERAQLEIQKNNALTFIKQTERELRDNEAKYKELIKANEQLDAELEKQLKELAAKSQQVYVGGKYMWPLDLKYNYISSYFGRRTLGGGVENHKALDIPANAGANIYAANSGTIVTATYHYSYGNYVVIDHGGGQATLYAHCSKILVKVGDKVNKGDVIAKVGTTGYSTGNHLHFEVRINGTAVDPLSGYVVKP